MQEWRGSARKGYGAGFGFFFVPCVIGQFLCFCAVLGGPRPTRAPPRTRAVDSRSLRRHQLFGRRGLSRLFRSGTLPPTYLDQVRVPFRQSILLSPKVSLLLFCRQ